MAKLTIQIVTQGPGAPKVVADGLDYLMPGDRLDFQSDTGDDVYVQAGGILLSLVKSAGAGLHIKDFHVNTLTDSGGNTVYAVNLTSSGGGSPDPDPPN